MHLSDPPVKQLFRLYNITRFHFRCLILVYVVVDLLQFAKNDKGTAVLICSVVRAREPRHFRELYACVR